MQDRIPAPKVQAARSTLHFACVVVRDRAGRVLLEKRASTGLWADMWQPPTLEAGGRKPVRGAVAKALGAGSLKRIEGFVHQTTHRDVHFTVYGAEGVDVVGRRWFTAAEAAKLPASLKVAGALESDIPALAAAAAEQWTGTFNPRTFDAAAAQSLYERAW